MNLSDIISIDMWIGVTLGFMILTCMLYSGIKNYLHIPARKDALGESQ